MYQEKDRTYDYFLRHGTFEGNGLARVEVPRNKDDLLIVLGWMLLIGVPSIFYFCRFLWTSSLVAQLLVLLVVGLGKNARSGVCLALSDRILL